MLFSTHAERWTLFRDERLVVKRDLIRLGPTSRN
jgi:hypothetical protein